MAVKTAQAVINGQTYNLVLNTTTGNYEAAITAPATSSYTKTGHFYGVTIKPEDIAGNITSVDETHATLGSSLRLIVKENTAPVITITYPTASALIINNKPVVTWTVTDNDSGVNPETIKITIDNGTEITDGITKTPVTGGYQCSYTPETALADGSHTIKIDVSDFDGNAAEQKSVTFKIDTVPPTLNVTSPVNNLVTNQTSCTVAGTTNDTASSPCTVTVKLNDGAAEEVTVNDNGAFSKALTISDGANTIVITSVDSAGKSTTITRTVTLDTKAPEILEVTLTPNPVGVGQTFVISVKITD